MKLELNCVVSLHTKSEEKLPLGNILLFLLFEMARSYNLFNMTALSGENPKRWNTEHRSTEGSKHRKVMIPATQVWDRILYHTAVVSCHTDISYRTDASYNTDISCLDIIYSHYYNTPSWHHIPSCRYYVMLIYCAVSYHTIRIFQLLIQYHTYIEATAIICVTKLILWRDQAVAIELKVFELVTPFRV